MEDSNKSLIAKIKSFSGTDLFGKVWKYASVSIISTLLTLALVTFFFGLLKLGSIQSTVLANVISTIPAYFLTRNWAWGKSGRSDFWKEVAPFWIIAIVSTILAAIAADGADTLAKHFTHSHSLETVCVAGANLVTYGIIWLVKFFVFNNVLFANKSSEQDDQQNLVSETAEVS